MKLALPSAVKFTEPAPAVDLLGLQFPVEFVEAPPSKRPKLDDDSDSTITESTAVKESHKAEKKKKPLWLDFDENDPIEKAKAMAEFYSANSAIDLMAISTCPLCGETGTGHDSATCPLREEYMRTWCPECFGACKDVDNHGNDHVQKLMQCYICRELGTHWSDDCPKLNDSVSDDDYCPESGGWPHDIVFWPAGCHRIS